MSTETSQKSSVPMKKDHYLELENQSLKLHIMRRNLVDAERKFQISIESVFEVEGKNKEEWNIDLDRGLFVAK